MTEPQLTTLIRKYLSGEATAEEKEKVERWYAAFDESGLSIADSDGEKIKDASVKNLRAIRQKANANPTEAERLSDNKEDKIKIIRKLWLAAAIIVFILLSGVMYMTAYRHNQQGTAIVRKSIRQDFQPGGSKAVVTLANGQTIFLDSGYHNGLLAMQGNTKVIKAHSGSNGVLIYNNASESSPLRNKQHQNKKVLYNTIATPRGGIYKVVLPDGSKVWLNAASSIHFPTVFAGKKRSVAIKGEAYFEIVKNENRPFEVIADGIKIKVLGTDFNIKSYDDEKYTTTTLLKGAVKVTANHQFTKGQSSVLKPGQQAIVSQETPANEIKIKDHSILEEVMAWKNNLFWFQNTDVGEVMKQLARWYDVDINIKGNIPDLFTGSIPRNISLSKMFEILQKTGGIRYEIVNNETVVVMPSHKP